MDLYLSFKSNKVCLQRTDCISTAVLTAVLKISLFTGVGVCYHGSHHVARKCMVRCPIAVADPGFPVGGGGVHPLGGVCGPPTWALFGENVCKNERIGSHRGRAPGTPPPLDPPMHWYSLPVAENGYKGGGVRQKYGRKIQCTTVWAKSWKNITILLSEQS